MTPRNQFPSTPPATVNGMVLELMQLRRTTQKLENEMSEFKRVASIDDDGLEKETPLDNEFTWPFRTCKHKGWHECKRGGWHEEYSTWRLDPNRLVAVENQGDDNMADCCKYPNDLHKHYMRAWNAQRCGELDKAVAEYRVVMEQNPDPECPDDFMLQAFTCLDLGLLLSTRPCLRPSQCPHSEMHLTRFSFLKNNRNSEQHLTRDNFMKNEREAVQLFKKGAIAFKLPSCIDLYGHVLVYGTGGVKKNIAKGISLLNEAGSQCIGESFFELGSIYEQGVSDGTYKVDVDLSAARDYYLAAKQAYTFPNGHEGAWVPKIETVQRFLRSEGWHNMERASSTALGERLYWAITGQAFLFCAAASLAESTKPNHYAPLLLLLPLIGIFLATFSLSQIHEAILRNNKRREQVDSMLSAKMSAYRSILKASRVDLLFLEEGERPSLASQAQEDERRNATVNREEQKFKKHESRIKQLMCLRRCSERVLCFVSLVFFTVWLILLINEVRSENFHWWNT